jgi:hypothetical protein
VAEISQRALLALQRLGRRSSSSSGGLDTVLGNDLAPLVSRLCVILLLPTNLVSMTMFCGPFLALSGAITAGNLAFFMPRIWRAQRNGIVPRILAFDVPIQLSAILLLVSQVLNALGIGFSQNVGGFLIGLYLLVVISSLNFVFLLYILHRTPGDPPAA